MRARVLRAAAMAVGVGVCGLAIGSPAFAVGATAPTPPWPTNGRVNLIVNQETHWILLVITLAVMLALSTMLLVWAKRKGWF